MADRPYLHTLITYLSEAQLLKVLLSHHEQIRAYAYAYHDMDTYDEKHERAGELKEPHFHCVIQCYNGHSRSAVLRWFRGFVDDDGKPINTLNKAFNDKFEAFDYLDHSNRPHKYQYPHSIVKSNDFTFFDTEDLDTGNSIIEGMKKGTSYSSLRKRFGTHFILNFEKYKRYLEEELIYSKYDPETEFVVRAQKERYSQNLRIEDFEDIL